MAISRSTRADDVEEVRRNARLTGATKLSNRAPERGPDSAVERRGLRAAMRGNDSDETWKYFGKKDPYFGVLTHSVYRREQLTDDARKAFFETGERYIDFVMQTIRESLDPSFRPHRALDFGCGVGRLAIPIGRACGSVVGVDVSEAMLDEARRNSREQGLEDATFVKSDDDLSLCEGPFDFVHSCIVFQHIPRRRGEAILRRLVSLLRDDGIGALHFTYSFDASQKRRLLMDAYRKVPFLFGIRNIAKGRPFSEPMMQMNEYDVNRILRILHECGAQRIHVNLTKTGSFGAPFYGLVVYFQKRALDPWA
jgi:SAM-dependent methyltransferase